MSRIEETFRCVRTEGRIGLATFLTVGFPDRDATLPLLGAMIEGGADLLELGVPFSDPLADGATIQRASQRALENGITMTDCLEACAQARARFPQVPILFMGYYNPVLRYGIERFAVDAGRSGLDGVIVADLPPEEAAPLKAECSTRGVDLVFLLAPTSTEERIERVCSASTSLIYCVSITGTTGARADVDPGLPAFLGRVRARTSLPLLVGFGISSRAHVEKVGALADSVVVGSSLIDLIEEASAGQRLRAVREYVSELAGRKVLQN